MINRDRRTFKSESLRPPYFVRVWKCCSRYKCISYNFKLGNETKTKNGGRKSQIRRKRKPKQNQQDFNIMRESFCLHSYINAIHTKTVNAQVIWHNSKWCWWKEKKIFCFCNLAAFQFNKVTFSTENLLNPVSGINILTDSCKRFSW